MNFLTTFQNHFDKLDNMTVITQLWKEIIAGKKIEISTELLIEYSFHYPVDTDVYLEELNQKFDDSVKEELRTIDGNLKAYIQTFIYYCINSTDRIPTRTTLYASLLYMKIITLPTDIEKLYFEKYINVAIFKSLENICAKQSLFEEDILLLLRYIFTYASRSEVDFIIVQGTSNLFINIIKYRASERDLKQCDDNLVNYSLNSLKNLIEQKEQPNEIKYIIGSVLKCFRSKPYANISQNQRRLLVLISKAFIKDNILLQLQINSENKLQYFIDALFVLWSNPDFELLEDCVEMINLLDEDNYKELLRRIPNYLESKNHEKFYINLMKIIYQMLRSPHPRKFNKIDVLFSVCFRATFIHLLSKKRAIVEKTIDIFSKICLLENNYILESIFQLANETGKFVDIGSVAVLRVLANILETNKYSNNPVRNKNILNILSKFVVSLNAIEDNIASQIIYLLCKDGTPFSVKHMLQGLHELYLKLSEKSEKNVRLAILNVFHKMALHQDASSSTFLGHLYNSIIFPSNLKGKMYGPGCYSNLLLSDEFDYTIFMNKCRHLIKYDHVHHTIVNLNFKEPGYSVLLLALLEFIIYKEYKVITDYILENYKEISLVDSAAHLLAAFKIILVNSGVYDQRDLPKFDAIHSLLWDSLYREYCGIANINATFVLIEVLKTILQLEDDEVKKTNLLAISSESAYRALKFNQLSNGSVMQLTEICISLKRCPPPEILVIFENVIDHPDVMALMKTHCKDLVIQLVAFFGTIGMMNRTKIPSAYKLFRLALAIPDPVVQLTTIKIYYNLCTEITHEFEEIIRFCLDHVSTTHPVLSRVCVLILEELIHDNYVLLNSEDFLKFIHRLGSYSLHDFMKHTLESRFMLSNKHDIGRFYMSTLVFISGYTKFDNYPISGSFTDDLLVIRSLVDSPNDLIKYLFSSIQIKTRFDILREICNIFGTLTAGKCKVDLTFLDFFHYSLYTFKVMSSKTEFDYRINYYGQVCKSIEKQILNKDPKYHGLILYGEYEADVKFCTLMLLELLFFIKNEQLIHDFFFPVFDVVFCWIDHIKAEIVHYVHAERVKDFDHLLKRLVLFYKQEKKRLECFINNQESCTDPLTVEIVT